MCNQTLVERVEDPAREIKVRHYLEYVQCRTEVTGPGYGVSTHYEINNNGTHERLHNPAILCGGTEEIECLHAGDAKQPAEPSTTYLEAW